MSVVELLLRQGANLTLKETGSKALGLAVEYGHLSVIKVLLQEGVDLSHADEDGSPPLVVASRAGQIKAVRFLLAQGAYPSSLDKFGFSSVNEAARSGHTEVVRLLLSAGADMVISSVDGWSPVASAAINGYPATAKLLILSGAFRAARGLDRNFGTIAHCFAMKGFANLLRLIVEKENANLWEVDAHKHTLLHLAAKSGSVETCQFLMQKGLSITALDAKGDDVVAFAASGGSREVLRLILDQNPDQNTTSGLWSPLHWACKGGNAAVFELLITRGWKNMCAAIQDVPGNWTPLAIASYHGHSTMICTLSEQSRAALDASENARCTKGVYHDSRCNGCLHVGTRYSGRCISLMMNR